MKIILKNTKSISEQLKVNLFLKPALKILKSRRTNFWVMPHDTICREIFLKGFYEKGLLEAMLLTTPGRYAALDIGANIGNHSVFLSPHFDEVLSFEPSSSNFNYLISNLELNQISNITPFNFGLSEKSGIARMSNQADPKNTNDSISLTGGHGPQIEIQKGDSVDEIRNLKNISFIKIDVEGHEPEVIIGLKETIQHHMPQIFWEAFEFNEAKKSMDLLSDIGYKYFYHIHRKPIKKGLLGLLIRPFRSESIFIEALQENTSLTGMNLASSIKLT